MFKNIESVIEDAGLKGVDIGVRIVGKGVLSVMLSFNHGSDFDLKVLEKSDDANVTANADKIVALRSALNTPLVVVGSADELVGKLEKAIQNIREGLVVAATTYSDLDIAALLTKAATQAKSAKSGGKPKAAQASSAKSEPAKAASTELDDDEEEIDDEVDQEVTPVKSSKSQQEVKKEPAKAPAPETRDFDSFDSFDSL